MESDVLRKFEAQIELLSAKDLEKAVKRLDNEELDVFVEMMERRNAVLREELREKERIRELKRLNHEILARQVSSAVPEALREQLGRCFDALGAVSRK